MGKHTNQQPMGKHTNRLKLVFHVYCACEVDSEFLVFWLARMMTWHDIIWYDTPFCVSYLFLDKPTPKGNSPASVIFNMFPQGTILFWWRRFLWMYDDCWTPSFSMVRTYDLLSFLIKLIQNKVGRLEGWNVAPLHVIHLYSITLLHAKCWNGLGHQKTVSAISTWLPAVQLCKNARLVGAVISCAGFTNILTGSTQIIPSSGKYINQNQRNNFKITTFAGIKSHTNPVSSQEMWSIRALWWTLALTRTHPCGKWQPLDCAS